MPTFSILIAVYNAAPWLDACFDSLAAQTCADFEALCVDDCSTDESGAMLQRWCAADNRFKVWRTQQNGGQGAARNLALKYATGRYTLFLDADDMLAPDALAVLREAFEGATSKKENAEEKSAEEKAEEVEAENPVDAALLRLVKRWDGGSEEEVPIPEPANQRYFTGREACALNIDFRLHGVYAIRTDIHRKIPYITSPRNYGDDNTTLLHYLACRRVVPTAATYYYRQHATSSSHTDGLARLDILEADAQRRTIVEVAQLGREALRCCERHCWESFVGRYIEFFYKNHPSAADRRTAHRRFAAALRVMRPLRLNLLRPQHPSFLFLRPYCLFRLWQSLLFHAKKFLKRSA